MKVLVATMLLLSLVAGMRVDTSTADSASPAATKTSSITTSTTSGWFDIVSPILRAQRIFNAGHDSTPTTTPATHGHTLVEGKSTSHEGSEEDTDTASHIAAIAAMCLDDTDMASPECNFDRDLHEHLRQKLEEELSATVKEMTAFFAEAERAGRERRKLEMKLAALQDLQDNVEAELRLVGVVRRSTRAVFTRLDMVVLSCGAFLAGVVVGRI
jgi:hypothetical protein